MAPKRTVEQFNMSAVHARNTQAEQGLLLETLKHNYTYHHATGFLKTRTFQDHGDPGSWTEWHTMPVEDCAGPSVLPSINKKTE